MQSEIPYIFHPFTLRNHFLKVDSQFFIEEIFA
jgi:hypothetical protein